MPPKRKCDDEAAYTATKKRRLSPKPPRVTRANVRKGLAALHNESSPIEAPPVPSTQPQLPGAPEAVSPESESVLDELQPLEETRRMTAQTYAAHMRLWTPPMPIPVEDAPPVIRPGGPHMRLWTPPAFRPVQDASSVETQAGGPRTRRYTPPYLWMPGFMSSLERTSPTAEKPYANFRILHGQLSPRPPPWRRPSAADLSRLLLEGNVLLNPSPGFFDPQLLDPRLRDPVSSENHQQQSAYIPTDPAAALRKPSIAATPTSPPKIKLNKIVKRRTPSSRIPSLHSALGSVAPPRADRSPRLPYSPPVFPLRRISFIARFSNPPRLSRPKKVELEQIALNTPTLSQLETVDAYAPSPPPVIKNCVPIPTYEPHGEHQVVKGDIFEAIREGRETGLFEVHPVYSTHKANCECEWCKSTPEELAKKWIRAYRPFQGGMVIYENELIPESPPSEVVDVEARVDAAAERLDGVDQWVQDVNQKREESEEAREHWQWSEHCLKLDGRPEGCEHCYNPYCPCVCHVNDPHYSQTLDSQTEMVEIVDFGDIDWSAPTIARRRQMLITSPFGSAVGREPYLAPGFDGAAEDK